MDSKSNSLEQQYQEIVDYIDTYVDFVQTMIDRMKTKNPLHLSAWRRVLLNPLKLPDSVRTALPEIATDEEKSNVFFQIVTSDDPTDRMSAALRARFPDTEFGKVKRLHDLQQPKTGGTSSIANLIGLVIGVVGGILRSIAPSPGAEPTEHTPIERITFWVIVVGLVYFVVVMIPKWFRHARKKQAHNFAEYILSYTCIQMGE